MTDPGPRETTARRRPAAVPPAPEIDLTDDEREARDALLTGTEAALRSGGELVRLPRPAPPTDTEPIDGERRSDVDSWGRSERLRSLTRMAPRGLCNVAPEYRSRQLVGPRSGKRR